MDLLGISTSDDSTSIGFIGWDPLVCGTIFLFKRTSGYCLFWRKLLKTSFLLASNPKALLVSYESVM